jgi:hypothetical protein
MRLKLKASESDDTRNADDMELPSFELACAAAPNPNIFQADGDTVESSAIFPSENQ